MDESFGTKNDWVFEGIRQTIHIFLGLLFFQEYTVVSHFQEFSQHSRKNAQSIHVPPARLDSLPLHLLQPMYCIEIINSLNKQV